MKAAQISEYGDSSVVQINEVAKPTVAEGQILIEVYAASLNPFDSKIRAGFMKDTLPLTFPVTLGGDMAGVVVELGAGVADFVIGDKVYGQAHVVGGNSGAFAEFAATSAAQVATMPRHMDFKQAAAMPLVGVSALQALRDHIRLQPGQKLFIHGGAGGIGAVAIQIAKHSGAYVAVTASEDNGAYVTALGADEVINYQSQDFTQFLHGYDAVFDTVGGDDFSAAFAILKPGGIAVSMVAPTDMVKAKAFGVTALTQATKVTSQALSELRGLLEEGIVTPHIASEYRLQVVKDAFEARENSPSRGKIVITLK